MAAPCIDNDFLICLASAWADIRALPGIFMQPEWAEHHIAHWECPQCAADQRGLAA